MSTVSGMIIKMRPPAIRTKDNPSFAFESFHSKPLSSYMKVQETWT